MLIDHFSNSETFFKIGITKRSVADRYSTKSRMPYEHDTVLTILDEPGVIYDLEKKYKEGLKPYAHKPKVYFDGSVTECFTKLTIPC